MSLSFVARCELVRTKCGEQSKDSSGITLSFYIFVRGANTSISMSGIDASYAVSRRPVVIVWKAEHNIPAASAWWWNGSRGVKNADSLNPTPCDSYLSSYFSLRVLHIIFYSNLLKSLRPQQQAHEAILYTTVCL